VHLARDLEGVDAGAAIGQPRRGVQRVAAVVPAPARTTARAP
jgi:hypothetical protein